MITLYDFDPKSYAITATRVSDLPREGDLAFLDKAEKGEIYILENTELFSWDIPGELMRDGAASPGQNIFLMKIMTTIYHTRIHTYRNHYVFLLAMQYLLSMVRAGDPIEDIFFLPAEPGTSQNKVFIKFVGSSPARRNTIKDQDYYYSFDLIEQFVAKSQGI